MTDAAALVELGSAQLARGEIDAAFETARAAVAASPLDPATLWLAANAAEGAMSPDSLGHWARLAALVPDIAIVAIRHAHAALAANNPYLAREVLERLAARPAALAGATRDLRMQAAYCAQRAGALGLASGFARGVAGGEHHAGLLEWLAGMCRDMPARLPADTDLLLGCVAWGSAFADIFTKLTLPTLLAPGNLPALVEGRRASLLMIGDGAFRTRLEADPAIARLDALVRRVHVEIPAAAIANNPAIDVYGPVQILAFHAAKAMGCDFVLLHADLVYADGALAFLRRTGERGALAFCTQAFSAKLEPIAAALSGQATVPARRLMSLAFEHMHPRSAAMIVRADRQSTPSHATLFLFADPAGLRLRALQPSPMWVSRAVWPSSLPPTYDTQDNGLIHRLVPDPADLDRIVFGADSDEFAIVEVTPEDQGAVRTSAVATDGAIDAAIAGLAMAGRLLDPLRLRSFESESFLHGEARPAWADAPDPRPLIDATRKRLAERLERYRSVHPR